MCYLHRDFKGTFGHSLPIGHFKEVSSLTYRVTDVEFMSRFWHPVYLFSPKTTTSVTVWKGQMATACSTFNHVLELLRLVPAHNMWMPEIVVPVQTTRWGQSGPSASWNPHANQTKWDSACIVHGHFLLLYHRCYSTPPPPCKLYKLFPTLLNQKCRIRS